MQALTVTAWPSTIAEVASSPGGQIVTAVAPNSATSASGLAVGDVIRAVNGAPVDSPGQWLRAQRALNAGVAVGLDVDRAGVRTRLEHHPGSGLDGRAGLDKVYPRRHQSRDRRVRRARSVSPQVTAGAEARLAQLSTTDQHTAPGWFATGLIRLQTMRSVPGPRSTTRSRRPQMSEARFQRGIALIARGRPDLGEQGLAAASASDPADALAPTFRAFALLRADRFAEAFAADSSRSRSTRLRGGTHRDGHRTSSSAGRRRASRTSVRASR